MIYEGKHAEINGFQRREVFITLEYEAQNETFKHEILNNVKVFRFVKCFVKMLFCFQGLKMPSVYKWSSNKYPEWLILPFHFINSSLPRWAIKF
jgi:hypothetical protein